MQLSLCTEDTNCTANLKDGHPPITAEPTYKKDDISIDKVDTHVDRFPCEYNGNDGGYRKGQTIEILHSPVVCPQIINAQNQHSFRIMKSAC